MTLTIRVIAEILPGKEDPSAEAHFANATRAGQYATMLVASGDYSAVYVEHDGERYLIEGKRTCTCGGVDYVSCLCGLTPHEWFEFAKTHPRMNPFV